jgi:hypothetical protein
MTKTLIKLNKKEMRLVENEWHHAVLSFFTLYPTHDNRYNDMSLSDEEVDQIAEDYGVLPPSWMDTYWARQMTQLQKGA